MEKCYTCGQTLEVIKDQPYEYSECGLNVTLLGITQYRCRSCGEEFAAIPSPQKLHRVIGVEICRNKKALLKPKEIIFIRKELRLKAKDLARILGASDSVVSRWENGKATIGEGNDRLLRSIFLSYALPCSSEHECSPSMLDVLRDLPPKRKGMEQPTTITLNPQEWLLLDAVCTV
jgi:putative zinc finger/helix-turn-helix YgiT family protein